MKKEKLQRQLLEIRQSLEEIKTNQITLYHELLHLQEMAASERKDRPPADSE